LFGDANPAGRLPLTFYKADEKLPPFDDYSMQNRTYRYFEGEPLYPFGYGLSYTRFEYSNLQLDRSTLGASGQLEASIDVKNAGMRKGDEVVQLYVHPVDPKRTRAIKELRGLTRVTLMPGESRRITFDLEPRRDFWIYDDEARRYAVDPGRYEVQIGASSADIRARATVEISP
jgi:beta-glucosidase